jgi:hypothetical protein
MFTMMMIILIFILHDEAFKYADGANFLGYGGTDTEPLCVEFCNFVQCLVFSSY